MQDGAGLRETEANGAFDLSWRSPTHPPTATGSDVRTGSFEHRVSKMDTLAGIAIKYGVEVSDIKRMNGLVTDLQMFAHEKLQIPLPGRHPPSPVQSSGSSSNREDVSPNRRDRRDILESFSSLKPKSSKQRVSPAMSILQEYYGLTPPAKASAAEGTELTVYGTSRTLNIEDGDPPKGTSHSEPHRQKSRSPVSGSSRGNGILTAEAVVTRTPESGEADVSSTGHSVRRRQINDADPFIIGESSARSAKRLAPRPKYGSRMDMDSSRTDAPVVGDSFKANGFALVRKSSSTSNLQESTKRTPKSSVFSKPIFDGLPKPSSSRRNKAALD